MGEARGRRREGAQARRQQVGLPRERDASGRLVRHKASVVAQGYSAIPAPISRTRVRPW